jgi:hypothetical protein
LTVGFGTDFLTLREFSEDSGLFSPVNACEWMNETGFSAAFWLNLIWERRKNAM